MREQKKVFVGLSGGVDSSVAAARLLARGFDVTGVFIKVWHPDWLVCDWEQERLDAMRVAAKLDIPFLTCDAVDAYKNEVADYFIESYKAGYTPNPDVLCNQYVKFGAFLRFAEEHGADYVATGHYAQRIDKEATATMHRGLDSNKDQTYFLWTLSQSQLRKTLFPVGDTPKEQIRAEAAKLNLITSEKKDSQGICFLGHIDIKEFLSHYTTLVPGKVLNDVGEVIGTHEGSIMYTLGQRQGFTVTKKSTTDKPMYVVAKNFKKNTITVATDKPIIQQNSYISLIKTNWIATTPKVGDIIDIQIRYRQTPLQAAFTAVGDKTATLQLLEIADKPANGQSCVCYSDSQCLGGGIIVTT